MKEDKLMVLVSTMIASFLEVELKNKDISEKTIDVIFEELDQRSLLRVKKLLERGTNVKLKGNFSETLLRSPFERKPRNGLGPVTSFTFEVTLNDLLNETAKGFI